MVTDFFPRRSGFLIFSAGISLQRVKKYNLKSSELIIRANNIQHLCAIEGRNIKKKYQTMPSLFSPPCLISHLVLPNLLRQYFCICSFPFAVMPQSLQLSRSSPLGLLWKPLGYSIYLLLSIFGYHTILLEMQLASKNKRRIWKASFHCFLKQNRTILF